MSIFTTEITSEKITSDNPIHQRLFRAYVESVPFIRGDVLELGCGEGRGIDLINQKAKTFTAVDKIDSDLNFTLYFDLSNANLVVALLL